jgi:enamine deaminase RidA (YjgF/YER057c/UK114 family)
MLKREILSVPGVPTHANPIPQGVKLDRFVFSSLVTGRDAKTNKYPDSIQDQVKNAFASMRALLAAAGATPANIGLLTVYLNDRADRVHVNPSWLEMFPDEHDRPARMTLKMELDDGAKIMMSFTAVL